MDEQEKIYQCPECKESDNFTIYGIATVKCTVDGQADTFDTEQGDIEWESTSAMRCNNCDYDATVKQFQIE
jgi:hypothetical protein